ncbi:MAG TPA: Gfo/Idh/MocA family oxidoreductase [Cyclobacteriaceae bacterium]|nr:Gfo/Idh/MocA family oxidoreductase [Cyclobacteriaceae bacterium]HMV10158.1 Gfo/Idh/MocA family oxidoreductase [Cyclobacteriaceae bacterium]HMV90733.1 Gfo/Idh/MocA family oxidoreductase [Cyclobacteriaceae bacterium]HMX00527.1 Gfo/Idh/MocA family oxidoreductase [Cyclobacteriaceae bacterium]HMX49598.1 Gfo/Idh/MocA family oxidoreductase [Cyclobacteriaceae bacterium]
MKNFALIGVAGYIAPRHLQAIRDTKNNLVAALDKFDTVGILDSYFPSADFFTEFERFDRHLDKQRRLGNKIDYVSICTPNYLHDSHIRFALRHQADAICEKPLVLNPWNVDALEEIEKETGKRVFTILQLRLHPSIIALKKEIEASAKDKTFDVDLTYITSRGHWYQTSWKGDNSKSGGVATNIGIHFFDMLAWVFGDVKKNTVHLLSADSAAGVLELGKAKVRWFLSIDYNNVPDDLKAKGKRTYRSLTMEGREIEFSDGFTDLHTKSYEQILLGTGFGLKEARPSIQTVYEIRNQEIAPLVGDYHPMLKNKK